jgi:hypothetical protein
MTFPTPQLVGGVLEVYQPDAEFAGGLVAEQRAARDHRECVGNDLCGLAKARLRDIGVRERAIRANRKFSLSNSSGFGGVKLFPLAQAVCNRLADTIEFIRRIPAFAISLITKSSSSFRHPCLRSGHRAGSRKIRSAHCHAASFASAAAPGLRPRRAAGGGGDTIAC